MLRLRKQSVYGHRKVFIIKYVCAQQTKKLREVACDYNGSIYGRRI